MLYLLHGKDEFTRAEELAKLKKKLGDPSLVSLNTTVLNGRGVILNDLLQACDAAPFMLDRRLVIVQDFWSRFEPAEGRRSKERLPKLSGSDASLVKGLAEYLPHVPETTCLVFVESRLLSPSNPAFGALPGNKGQAHIREFSPPAERDLGLWVEQRMRAKGGNIAPDAARELAGFIGSQLRALDQELEKLLAYVNYQRPVTMTDVRAVCKTAQTPTVFALVDSIGLCQAHGATEHLHKLIEEGESLLGLLAMIERQFRILLQVKELHARGATTSQMQKALGIGYAFIVEKSVRQARNFSMERLESIYTHLANVEQSIKTGEISDVLALDVLVTELCS